MASKMGLTFMIYLPYNKKYNIDRLCEPFTAVYLAVK